MYTTIVVAVIAAVAIALLLLERRSLLRLIDLRIESLAVKLEKHEQQLQTKVKVEAQAIVKDTEVEVKQTIGVLEGVAHRVR